MKRPKHFTTGITRRLCTKASKKAGAATPLNKGCERVTKGRGITPEIAQEIQEKKGLKLTNLRKIRVEKGLSQQKLAEVSGVTKRMIECYEQGYRNIDGAKFEALCDLSLALECDITDILESEELIEKYKKVKGGA